MRKQTITIILGIILTSFAASAYGQGNSFVLDSPYEDWTMRGVKNGCHNEISIAVHRETDEPSEGGNSYWYELSYIPWNSRGTINFRYVLAADEAEAKRHIMAGELRSARLTAGDKPFRDRTYINNPSGLFFYAGYYITEPSTTGTFEGCTVGKDSPDFLCMWNPIEGCPNFKKIKEERAKIINDPENKEVFENKAYGDLPDKTSGDNTKTPVKIGGTQTSGGGGQTQGQTTGGGGQTQGNAQRENERKTYRFDSVCSRNYELLVQRMGDTPNYAASYDLFHRDTNKLWMSIAQPCMGYDPKMKEGYDAAADTVRSVDQHCAGAHNRAECTQWGEFGNPVANEKWFRLFEAEARKAISDPNYSQELTGSVRPATGSSSGSGSGNTTGGGQGTSTGSDGSGSMTSSSGSCQSGLDQLDQELRGINAHRPQSASTIAQLQVLMYATSKAMQHMQAACQGQPQYSQYASYKTTYDQALNTCLSITTSPSYCVAKVAW